MDVDISSMSIEQLEHPENMSDDLLRIILVHRGLTQAPDLGHFQLRDYYDSLVLPQPRYEPTPREMRIRARAVLLGSTSKVKLFPQGDRHLESVGQASNIANQLKRGHGHSCQESEPPLKKSGPYPSLSTIQVSESETVQVQVSSLSKTSQKMLDILGQTKKKIVPITFP